MVPVSIRKLSVTTLLAGCGLCAVLFALTTAQGYEAPLPKTTSPAALAHVEQQLRHAEQRVKLLQTQARTLRTDILKVQTDVQTHLQTLAQEGLITLSGGGG